MEYRTLGRTGIKTSVFGLGCGGHSRLGLRQDKGEANAIAVVRRALESGVNFVDTAEAYGTEEVVGKALREMATPRASVFLSTKVSLHRTDEPVLRSASEIKEAAEGCLRRLQVDYVDILHLHGVPLREYGYCVSELVPALQSLRSAGKIRFLGITEAFIPDPGHETLQRAVQDDFWDVMMVGFNFVNQSARERVLQVTQQKSVGTLNMFAVRRALNSPEALRELLSELIEQKLVAPEALTESGPLGFTFAEDAAEALPDVAYRFCRDEPGMDVVLSGTGNPDHLTANLRSLSGPPLPESLTNSLRDLFARVDNVSGN